MLAFTVEPDGVDPAGERSPNCQRGRRWDDRLTQQGRTRPRTPKPSALLLHLLFLLLAAPRSPALDESATIAPFYMGSNLKMLRPMPELN
ncbi:hypothetical protein NKG99_07355 [Mesorhizobium sp. M1409]|uniref:hypothetical protein n=1 Tax=unclassified Mesorhizobium TaxID=325217 RepID=UPI003336DD43